MKEVYMDPIILTGITTQVAAILTVFLGKVGEAVSTKFGEDVYEECKHLYEVVRKHFVKKDDNGRASRALQNFADDTQLYSNAFKEMLLSSLQTDSAFADTLNQILHSPPIQSIKVGLDAKVEHIDIGNELGQGSQTIEGGDRTIFSDISMNIGPKRDQKK
jgi:hypothetical protein